MHSCSRTYFGLRKRLAVQILEKLVAFKAPPFPFAPAPLRGELGISNPSFFYDALYLLERQGRIERRDPQGTRKRKVWWYVG